MFQHERSLVSKMKNRPFTLLGVNTDKNVADVKQKNKQENITWRSWFDGPRTITGQYQLEAFPTLFLIDAKGVIKQKWVGAPPAQQLDKAIEELVKDVEKSGATANVSEADKPGEEKPAAGGGSDATAPIGFNVGNRAPEISGKDTTGKAFKLSEYKGKVVVLDFWGFW